MPHAQHIHFGTQAAHECPGVADDANQDFRLNTAEGLGKYDFKGAGKSELDPNLPAEATDPVACGVLRMHR